jgi:sodium transport system ATP-binding protein
VIEVRGVSKAFGEVEALRGVSFVAVDGRVTGVLGPNGAGKTTLLRIITTVLEPDQGEVRVDGHDTLGAAEAVQRRIGVLPHAHGLYQRLTAREHIRYFGRLHGLPPAQLEAQIDRMIELLEMRDFADRRARGFSEGQRVKVAIARALVHDPKNIILDEPTAGLDVTSTRAMRGILRRLREEGCCVLLSSHIMQEVSALCDLIVVIAGGKVVASGSPEELRRSTGEANLEDAFVRVIGSGEGLR